MKTEPRAEWMRDEQGRSVVVLRHEDRDVVVDCADFVDDRKRRAQVLRQEEIDRCGGAIVEALRALRRRVARRAAAPARAA